MSKARRLQQLREDYAAAWAPLRAAIESDAFPEEGKQLLRDSLEKALAESLSGAEEELLASYAR